MIYYLIGCSLLSAWFWIATWSSYQELLDITMDKIHWITKYSTILVLVIATDSLFFILRFIIHGLVS